MTELLKIPAAYTQVYRRIGFSEADLSSTDNVLTGSKSGQAVAGFNRKIALKLDASSPYSIDTYDVRNYSGSYRAKIAEASDNTVKYTDAFDGTLYPSRSFDHLISDFADVESEALSKLYEKHAALKTELQSIAVLGEMHQTLHMIRHPFDSLIKQTEGYFAALRKRKSTVSKLPVKYRKPEWSKIVTGTYLEWVFGMMPTYLDIKAGLEALDRLRKGDPITRRIQAQSNTSSFYELVPAIFKSTTGIVLVFERRENISTELGVKWIAGVRIQEEVANLSLDKALELYGFRLDEFVPSVYEITPWSWLIDYFTNLGDLLRAGTADTANLTYVVVDRRQKSVLLQTPAVVPPAPWFTGQFVVESTSGDLGQSVTTRTTLEREPFANLPMPSIIVHHPGDNVKRLLNMLAVANSLRGASRELAWLSRKGA